jgi:hypothetical protein
MKRASLRLLFQRGGWKESQYERCTGLSFLCFIYLDKKPRLKTMEQSLTWLLILVFLLF